jgi:hypothetical protein
MGVRMSLHLTHKTGEWPTLAKTQPKIYLHRDLPIIMRKGPWKICNVDYYSNLIQNVNIST